MKSLTHLILLTALLKSLIPGLATANYQTFMWHDIEPGSTEWHEIKLNFFIQHHLEQITGQFIDPNLFRISVNSKIKKIIKNRNARSVQENFNINALGMNHSLRMEISPPSKEIIEYIEKINASIYLKESIPDDSMKSLTHLFKKELAFASKADLIITFHPVHTFSTPWTSWLYAHRYYGIAIILIALCFFTLLIIQRMTKAFSMFLKSPLVGLDYSPLIQSQKTNIYTPISLTNDSSQLQEQDLETLISARETMTIFNNNVDAALQDLVSQGEFSKAQALCRYNFPESIFQTLPSETLKTVLLSVDFITQGNVLSQLPDKKRHEVLTIILRHSPKLHSQLLIELSSNKTPNEDKNYSLIQKKIRNDYSLWSIIKPIVISKFSKKNQTGKKNVSSAA